LNQVKLIWSVENLKKYIQNSSINSSSITVLNLGKENLEKFNDFESHKVNIISINDLIDNNPDQFLKDYRDLIGMISNKSQSRYWLSSNIASKNRFTSKIPELLKQVEACSVAISKGYNNLIIYYPDLSIVSTINEMIRKVNFQSTISKKLFNIKILYKHYKYMLYHIYSMLSLCKRLIIVRLFYRKKFDDSNNNFVLKTFFYESTIDQKNSNKYHDPIFGRLPDFLNNNGKLLIIVKIIGNYKICIDKIMCYKKFNIIPIEYWLSLNIIVKSFFKIIFCPIIKEIPDELYYRDINVSSIIKLELFKKFNDVPINQYVYYDMILKCFNNCNAEQYIHSYENNPWEKMAISAIREISPSTKIIGFQHAVAPQSSVNLFNSKYEINKMPLPDKIVCVGKEPLDIITKYSSKSMDDLTIGCGLRYEYLEHLSKKVRSNIQDILVVPEGITNVSTMLNFVIKELSNNNRYKVVIRFHPALKYESLKNKLNIDLFQTSNISISKLSLEEDLLNSDLCIYWGSTVALEALSMGIPIVHYNMKTHLSFDPLFRCNYLKWKISNNESLIKLIETIDSLDDDDFSFQMKHAKKYINNYFYPVNDKNMSNFLYN